MERRDYYVILGITQAETPEGVREAYRELALRYHPDRAGERAAGPFQEIVEAYRVLSDPQQRAGYDRGLRHGGQPQRQNRPLTTPQVLAGRRGALVPQRLSLLRDFEAGVPSVEEVFVRLMRNFGGSTPKSERLEPLDLEIVIGADLAARGGMLTLAVPVFFPCAACRGSGTGAGAGCAACEGRGMAEEERNASIYVPPLVRDGACFEVPLRGLGIHNLFLRVRLRVRP